MVIILFYGDICSVPLREQRAHCGTVDSGHLLSEDNRAIYCVLELCLKVTIKLLKHDQCCFSLSIMAFTVNINLNRSIFIVTTSGRHQLPGRCMVLAQYYLLHRVGLKGSKQVDLCPEFNEKKTCYYIGKTVYSRYFAKSDKLDQSMLMLFSSPAHSPHILRVLRKKQ